MKESPILFSGTMVRAILEGRKTQTRRVIRPQPVGADATALWAWCVDSTARSLVGSVGCSVLDPKGDVYGLPGGRRREIARVRCPYGAPGDRLWVRETWAAHPLDESDPPARILLQADGANYVCPTLPDRVERGPSHLDAPDWAPKRWRPSIHMPRWASRITLDVVSVRVERLQAISDDDARAEGVELSPSTVVQASRTPYRVGFHRLWESINGDRPGCSWADDPWVWVVEWAPLQGAA